MQIEQIDPKLLIPYEKNPRKNDAAIAKIAIAIKEFGFRVPVLAKKDKKLIDGHLRLKAALKIGLEMIPVVYVDDLTETQIKAFRLSVNRMAELADWDEDLLAAELQELKELDFDLELTGFDFDAIEKMLEDTTASLGLTDADITPECPEHPQSRLGDVWLCGDHRIMCGSWLEEEHREALMGSKNADMIFTDPPYNANYSSRVDKGRRKEWGGIANDNMSDKDYDDFIYVVFNAANRYLKDNSVIYACIDWKSYPILAHQIGYIFSHKSTIIWDKGSIGLGTYYRTQYELILFALKGAKMGVWNAGHDEKDVWTISRESLQNYVHPTQKPVAVPERAILNSSNRKDIVLDMFCGSGSTLIACQANERTCYTIDIDPRYVDVAVKRWEDYTGKKAIHEKTGEVFKNVEQNN